MIVVHTAEVAEQALSEGQLVCPGRGCGDTLQRWGYGRSRHVRSLRRGGDRRAAPAGALPQMRNHPCAPASGATAAPGRYHRGDRHRTRPQSRRHRASQDRHRAEPLTVDPVRRWLRRARDQRPFTQLWQRGAQALIRLNADAFNELPGTVKLLCDALTMLAAAAWWTQRRLGINEPLWTLIGLHSHGRLLAPG